LTIDELKALEVDESKDRGSTFLGILEEFLNEDYRLNISSFRLADAEAVENGVKNLAADLENGRWEKSYGEILKTDKIDAGYYFLLAK
jgi:hypothetical protein